MSISFHSDESLDKIPKDVIEMGQKYGQIGFKDYPRPSLQDTLAKIESLDLVYSSEYPRVINISFHFKICSLTFDSLLTDLITHRYIYYSLLLTKFSMI